MAKSNEAKKKNEGKKKKPSKNQKKNLRKRKAEARRLKAGSLKQKATNKYNSSALESIYGSITRDSKNWGMKTRAMTEAAKEGKPYGYKKGGYCLRRRQRPIDTSNRKAPPPKSQFQLRMPSKVPDNQIPWWTKPMLKSSPKKMKLLDEIKVDAQAMYVLDHELKAFSNYVQLSAKEIETRDNLVQTVRREAKERFGIRDSDVKVFGSFAARPVCTFESDVDLVIWGLVGNQQPSWKSEEQYNNNVQIEAAPLPQAKEPQPEHPNVKKQIRILKWKAALDEFEKQAASEAAEKGNAKSETTIDADSKPAAREIPEGKDDSDTAPTVSNSESQSPLSDNGQFEDPDENPSTNEAESSDTMGPEEAPLFVIDRIGDDSVVPTSEAKAVTNYNEVAAAADASAQANEAAAQPDTELASPSTESKMAEVAAAADASAEASEAVAQPDTEPTSPPTESEIAADSDDDTADKLEGLKSREETSQLDTSGEGSEFHGLPLPDAEGLYDGAYFEEMRDAILEDGEDGEDDEQEEDLITTPKIRKRSHSLVSLSSATTCSDNQMINEDGLEVSFVTDSPSPSRSIITTRRPQKLSDNVRQIVNSKLNQLSKRMRKTGVAKSIELRKWARVPILNIQTVFGYECDIGVGGHNGNDTSAYAGAQVSQHPSFAPVVMVLKILLNQHDLDKPFTGGLGSFKLYVLVASHIQQHLAFGGSSTPSEILMTFFYRYGDIRNYRHVNPNAKTDLKSVDRVHCHDGGVVEVGQVFQMENCVAVFRACWNKLMQVLGSPTTTSLLRLIVDARRLQRRREAANSIVKSKLFPIESIHLQRMSVAPSRPLPVRYSNHHRGGGGGENKAISKLFKGGKKSFKKNKYWGGRRKSK